MQENLSKDKPVHSACNWYYKYKDRKEKLKKLNDINQV
jgi:hypothetical protein